MLSFRHTNQTSKNVADTTFQVDQKKFGVGVGKNECGQSGHGTLKLTVSQE